MAGGRSRPTQCWLSTVPVQTSLTALVRLAKRRWIIERDYEERQLELGLGDYEGRGWRGFHHHATLCIVAYGFLVIERTLPRRAAGLGYAPRKFLPTSNPATRRTRAERHKPQSIATLQIEIVHVLLQQLTGGPFLLLTPFVTQ